MVILASTVRSKMVYVCGASQVLPKNLVSMDYLQALHQRNSPLPIGTNASVMSAKTHSQSLEIPQLKISILASSKTNPRTSIPASLASTASNIVNPFRLATDDVGNLSNSYIQIYASRMSNRLEGGNTSSPSRMTIRITEWSIFSRTRVLRLSSTPSKSIKPGRNVKVDSRSKNYVRIEAPNTWGT